MKKHINPLFACVIMGVFALAGCNNPIADAKQQGTDPAASGAVVVSIGMPADAKGARTIQPTLDGFTRYELTFSDGPEVHEPEAITEEGKTVTLPVGEWTITATAYSGEGDTEIASAQGSAAVIIKGSTSVQAPITLGPIPEGAAGTLRYSITVPEGAEGSLTLRPTAGADIPIQLLAETNEDTRSLPAGEYLLFVSLTRNDKRVGKTEVLHIYSGLESKVEFSFTADDFIEAAILNPEYAAFTDEAGAKSLPTNAAAITAATGSNTAVFAIVGGGTSVATIDPATGELTLVGTGPITVSLEITTAGGAITHIGTSESIAVTRLFVLTAGPAVNVPAGDTTANVIFTGASGLDLTKDDFSVSPGGTISTVNVTSDTATVTVTFAANTGTASKTYTVSTSTSKIKGNATVDITQAARAELSAGPDVSAMVSATTANVTFTGVSGLDLSAADFAVIGSEDVAISNTSVSGDTATVTVTFTAIPPASSMTVINTYTVSIASDSAKIRGGAKVDITHGRVKLSAGEAVRTAADAITANVIFTGASGLSLTKGDFAVSTDGTISDVKVDSNTATVSVTFLANESTSSKTYTVSIASSSAEIRGGAEVVITQAATPGSTDITIGFNYGGITIIGNKTSNVISKSGPLGLTSLSLSADDTFTGINWYVDGESKGTSASLVLNAVDYEVKIHSVTFTGWWKGSYLSSDPILFTVKY